MRVRPAGDAVDSDPGAVFEDDPHPGSSWNSLEPHTREPTVLSRVSCHPSHLNIDRFHWRCLSPGRIPGWVRTVIPVPRGDHLPFRTARLFFLSVQLEVFATPTRRYHGRTLIRPSSPACATPTENVFANTQVRHPRGPAAACSGHALGTPSPGQPTSDYGIHFTCIPAVVDVLSNSLW